MVIRLDNENDYKMYLKKADESARNSDEFNEVIYLYKAAMSGQKESLYLTIIAANQLRSAGYVEAAADLLCDVFKKGVRSEILFKTLLLCIEEFSKDRDIFEFYNFAYHCKVNPYFYKVHTEMELYESLNDDFHVNVLKPPQANGFLPYEENTNEKPDEEQLIKRISAVKNEPETNFELLFERRKRLSETALKPKIMHVQHFLQEGNCSKAVYECEFLLDEYPESESVKAKYVQVKLLDDVKTQDKKLQKVVEELEKIIPKKAETMESLLMYYLTFQKDLTPLLNEMLRFDYSEWFVVYTIFLILNSNHDSKSDSILRKLISNYQVSMLSGDYLYLFNMALMERRLSHDESSAEFIYKLKTINREVYPVQTMLTYYQKGEAELGMLPDYFPLSLEAALRENYKRFLREKHNRYENVYLKEAADYTAKYESELFIKNLKNFTAEENDISYLESLLTKIYLSDELKEKIVWHLIAILPKEKTVAVLYRFRIKKITLTPFSEIKQYGKKCEKLFFRPLFEHFHIDRIVPSYIALYPMRTKLNENQFAAALTLLTSDEFEEDVYTFYKIKNAQPIVDAVISIQNEFKGKGRG